MNNSTMRIEVETWMLESIEVWAVEPIRTAAPEHVCVRVRACTLGNPHPGWAQTAVFQNTAEGNYKLGRPLDGGVGALSGASCYRDSTGPTRGSHRMNNDSHHLAVTKTQAGVLR